MVIQSYGTTDNNEGLSSRGRSTEEQNTAQCTPTNKCSETPASFLLTESFRSQPRPTQPERLRVNLTLDFFPRIVLHFVWSLRACSVFQRSFIISACKTSQQLLKLPLIFRVDQEEADPAGINWQFGLKCLI